MTSDLCYSPTLRTQCGWVPGSYLTKRVQDLPGYTSSGDCQPGKMWENRKWASGVKRVRNPSNALRLAT